MYSGANSSSHGRRDGTSEITKNFLLPRLVRFLCGNDYHSSDYINLLNRRLGFLDRFFTNARKKEAERIRRLALTSSCDVVEWRVRTNLFCLDACTEYLRCENDSLGPKIVKEIDLPIVNPAMQESLYIHHLALRCFFSILECNLGKLESFGFRLTEHQGDLLIQAISHQFVLTMGRLSAEYPIILEPNICLPSTNGIVMLANALSPTMPESPKGFFAQGERMISQHSIGPDKLNIISIVGLEVAPSMLLEIIDNLHSIENIFVYHFAAEAVKRVTAGTKP